MAERLVRHFNGLKPTAWLEWRLLSRGHWSCIHMDGALRKLRWAPTLHAYAAFTRSIRPGDRLAEVDPPVLAAAYSGGRTEMVVGAGNASNVNDEYRVGIAGLASHADEAFWAEVFRTEACRGGAFAPVRFDNETLNLEMASHTVVTLRIPGLRLVKTAESSGPSSE